MRRSRELEEELKKRPADLGLWGGLAGGRIRYAGLNSMDISIKLYIYIYISKT